MSDLDVVVVIDDILSWRSSQMSDALLQRARDEILKLRRRLDASTVVRDQDRATARAEALEEAAQRCEGQRISSDALDPFEMAHNKMCEAFAMAIRALKDEHDTTDFAALRDAWRVAKDCIHDVRISTVFLGLDHAIMPFGAPELYETMIFGGEHDQDQWRYATRAEALVGHRHAVEQVTKDKRNE
jgi:hypothetical protein